jgi:hypothetical protein
VAHERAGFEVGPGDPTAANVMQAIDVVLIVLVATVICVRLPGHPIGWVMLASGSALAIVVGAQAYVLSSFGSDAVGLPSPDIAAWIYAFSGGITFVSMALLLLLFPTGRPLSSAWARMFAIALVVCSAAMILVFAGPGPLSQARGIANPFGLEAIGAIPPEVRDAAFIVPATVLIAIGASSMITRYRRGSSRERLQLRWIGSAVALVTISFITVSIRGALAALAGQEGPLIQGALEVTIIYAAVAAIPIAIGIAVLRYRLYEIDRLISRTIGWAIVTGLLVSAFVVLVLGLQAVLQPLTGGGTLAVAASTLVVAALFSPVRRRVHAAVDRRFDRGRYDGERLLAAFGERLRDEVDLATIRADVLATVDAAVRPARAGLWLREGPRS